MNQTQGKAAMASIRMLQEGRHACPGRLPKAADIPAALATGDVFGSQIRGGQ